MNKKNKKKSKIKSFLVPLVIVSGVSSIGTGASLSKNSSNYHFISTYNDIDTENNKSFYGTTIKERGYNIEELELMSSISHISNLMDNYEDNEDEIINILEMKKESEFPKYFKYAYFSFSDSNKSLLLSAILKSDIKIINPWFKEILILAKESKNKILSIKAKRIFELYSEEYGSV